MRTTANDPAKLNDSLNTVDAEMRKRGIRFIPSQYVKKCVRSAVYKLKELGSVRLDDHNVILRKGGGFENARPTMKYHEQHSFSSQGNK
jgi:hypothetical protein